MTAQAAAVMHSPIDVPMGHPSFAGHFPQFPVLPGVVLLDEALQLIGTARGIEVAQWRLTTVKFLDAVRPGDALRLEHAQAGGTIRFTIHAASRLVARGCLVNAAAGR